MDNAISAYKGQGCIRLYSQANSHVVQGHACTQGTCHMRLSLNPQALVFQGLPENTGASPTKPSCVIGPSHMSPICTGMSLSHESILAPNDHSHLITSCTHRFLSHEPSLYTQALLHETSPAPTGSCSMRSLLQTKANIASGHTYAHRLLLHEDISVAKANVG